MLLATLLAACGDGSSTDQPALATPTAAPAAALPLDRFHYTASLTLREAGGGSEAGELFVSTSGDFQWPDRHSLTYTTDLGEGAIVRSVVIIDETAWFRQDGEPWRKTDRDDEQVADVLDVAFSAVRPDFLGGPEFEAVRANVRDLPSTEERVNDVTANHYRVGTEGRRFFESFLAADQAFENIENVRWELWLAKLGGWPVRLLVTGTFTSDVRMLDSLELEAPTLWELRIDVSRPNDPTLLVQSPDED
ncbi:MAG: hypothetical protein WD939_02965 [Dehalococcoidia bacterium]